MNTLSHARAAGCVGLLLLTLTACGGDDAETPSLVGTWHVDKEHYRTLLLADLGQDGVTGGRADHASIGLHLSQLRIVLVLAANGTWRLRGSVGMDPVDDTGTWSVTADAITLRFTHQQGRPITKTVTGKIAADGSLHVRTSPSQPGAFRLVRR